MYRNHFYGYFNEFFFKFKLIGTIDTNYLAEKFAYKKLKCLQGSHSFNGSCYFISNKKYSDSTYEAELLIETLMKMRKGAKKISSSLDSTPLGTAAEIASLPTDTNWKNAVDYCSQLNNESTLLYFDNNNQEEFDFIINLVGRLNFPNFVPSKQPESDRLVNNKNRVPLEELKYFIGLTFNSKLVPIFVNIFCS